jgi:hypothetical protein
METAMTNRMDSQPGPQFPPALADDLRRLCPPGPPVPPGRDGEILARARSHFARGRRLRLIFRFAGASGAAAAAILLAVWLGQTGKSPGPALAPAEAIAAREDIDRNGRVDVRDAFALARRIERGAQAGQARGGGPPAGLTLAPAADLPDLNGDGRVDRADVESIAMAAVRLERGSLQ